MKTTLFCCLILSALTVDGLLAQNQGQPQGAEVFTSLPAQKIGPNDLIAITVYGSPEFTRPVRVGADGEIRLPMLSRRIHAGGLMPVDLEESIAAALREEEIVVEPVVTVTIAEYHSRPVSVIGAVHAPGTFQADTSLTLLDALSKAGGLTPEAGPDILVSQGRIVLDGGETLPGSLVQRISVKALIDGADPAMNIVLKGGEEVRVPEAGKIYVAGNVHKPGVFPLQNGETSILKVLAEAEGLMQFAGPLAYIYRTEGGSGSKNEIPVELTKIMERKSPDVPMLAGDILYVPDNKRQRMTIGALEKLLVIGGGATAALVYTLK
jgi:polysaccharide export outer membrane protein